ncbi:MAG: potassium channel family protein [Alphaproteobacteria bacterium]|nr:potassium channel family protein [Alphaproteobacteria bacterium]
MLRTLFSILKSRDVYLLASLILLILVTPFFEGAPVGSTVIDILLTLVLLATVAAASDVRAVRGVILVVALAATALIWWDAIYQVTTARLIGQILFILICVATNVLVLRKIVAASVVDRDILCAGVGLYLLLGVTWTLIYIVLDTIAPEAFALTGASTGQGWSNYLYFSFATLTTLGYGDIAPHTPVARVWAAAEAVTGVLYVAVLVARLVSLYRA